ncbi:MAG: hypothetical protein ACR2IF_05155 [Terriglobales bacterium]
MSKYVCALFLALIALAGCQSGTAPQPASKAAPAKKEEPTTTYTGREAFYKTYAAARLWAPDARPFKVTSEINKDSNGRDGKSAIWRVGFASAARRSIKTFVWSGTHSEDAPPFGVNSGTEDTYNTSNSSTQVFDPQFLKVDTDKALETSQQHGGAKLLKQNEKLPIVYQLDWDPRDNILTWHVIYGSNRPDAKLVVAVNASTGDFERAEK